MTAFAQDVVALEAPSPAPLASVSEPDAIRVLLIEDGVIDSGFSTDELSKTNQPASITETSAATQQP